MASIFNTILAKKPQQTLFDLSHEVKLTTEFGRLTPVLCHKWLPSDRGTLDSEMMIRVAPMLAPIMSRVNAYVHHFMVPERLLWKDFKDFITRGKDGNQYPVVPSVQITFNQLRDYPSLFCEGSLWDYLGFPTLTTKDMDDWDAIPVMGNEDATRKRNEQKLLNNGVGTSFHLRVPLMPFLAYYKIWQTYYADENLHDFPIDEDFMLESGELHSITENLPGAPGVQIMELFKTRQRCWEKDYFTSALPFPQRGEDVPMPIQGMVSGTIPAEGIAIDRALASNYSSDVTQSDLVTKAQQGTARATIGAEKNGTATLVRLTNSSKSNVQIDLSKTDLGTINDLRRAFAVQRWLERNARAGYRYIEQIFSHFAVKSSDARLQRPQYLGGSKSPIMVGEVLQTSESTDNSKLGTMAGRGIGAVNSNRSKFYCEEHSISISILSIIPRSSYMQGFPRLFNQWTFDEYAWPEFANLGEQEVKNMELKLDTSDDCAVNNIKTFGYQSRYAEYKYIPSSIHGDMRTNMLFWHLGRKIDSKPALNSDFVEVNPQETSRIFAVSEYEDGKALDHFWIQIYNNVKAIRPLPKYGTPRL